MKTATARTNIECNVTCPYCDTYQDRLDELREHFNSGEPRAEECDAELECNNCKETFIVDLIEY
jgi:hypothetical protein